jgi:hypothetical protein
VSALGTRTAAGPRPLISGLMVLLVIAVVGVAQTSPGQSVLRSLGLAAPRQPFTSLFFADPNVVATQTESVHHGTSTHEIPFVIANHQHRRADYAWRVTIGGAPGPTGQSSVAAGAQATVTAPVTVDCRTAARTAAGVALQVTLAQPSRQISYWFRCRR